MKRLNVEFNILDLMHVNFSVGYASDLNVRYLWRLFGLTETTFSLVTSHNRSYSTFLHNQNIQNI